jgi:hypothetical protein
LKTVEERIIDGVWDLLLGGVNFYLSEMDEAAPLLGKPSTGLSRFGVVPAVSLGSCEVSEEERVLRTECFLVSVEIRAAERLCWFYTYAVKRALSDDRTLGGVCADARFSRAVYEGGVKFVLKAAVEG